MTQTPQSTAASRRNKILMQLLAFMALAVLLYYRPKIEAWLEASKTASSDKPPISEKPANMPAERPRFQRSGTSIGLEAEVPGNFERQNSDSDDEDDIVFPKSAGNAAVVPNMGPAADRDVDQAGEKTSDGAKEASDGSSQSKPDGEASDTPSVGDSEESKSDTRDADTKDAVDSKDPDTKSADDTDAGKANTGKTDAGSKLPESPAASKSSEGKKSGKSNSVSRMERDPAPRRTAGGSANDAASKTNGSTAQNPEWGKLKEIRNNVFESTAGLVYRSGSADGHRLKHVMQHAKDNTSKPVHGVFVGEGDREIVLAIIDEAFDKTKKNGNKDVRKEEEGERVVFTVNMKRAVGFMGGQEGERRGNPECRFIRIVLENDNEVISAFPTNR